MTHIELNRALLGPRANPRLERTALHYVRKVNDLDYGKDTTLPEARLLRTAWAREGSVTSVTTQHAAVNGMLNDLEKAIWLMGVHSRQAYPQDDVKHYTLFHNPSESVLLDLYECVRDSLGLPTENAKYLAAALADVQRKGTPVKWVVHSQGGIIFTQAVAHHLKKHPGQLLNNNSVVFHAGGNNKKTTDKLLSRAGIRKNSPDKDNPFDLVPALAGRNDLSLRSIKRTAGFWQKVKGNDESSTLESPHTLPYISLDAYQHFLTLAGDITSAQKVRRHMASLAKRS